MELILVRHARPERVDGRAGAIADPGLTDLGVRQARAVADWLADEDLAAVYSSPARRAMDTAAIIAARHAIEAGVDERLVEFDFGASAYVPTEEVADPRNLPGWEDWEPWLRPLVPGDAPDVFRRRVASAVQGLAAAHPSRTVVAVCHGGTINAALTDLLDVERGLIVQAEYTSIHRLMISSRGLRMVGSVNETAHLRAIQGGSGSEQGAR